MVAAVRLLLVLFSQSGKAALDVRFSQDTYSVAPGEVFTVTAVISPVPTNGIYSFGVRIDFPPEQARVLSVQAIQVNRVLDQDGPRQNSAVAGFGSGFAAAKGTADFHSELRPVSNDAALVAFEVQDLGADDSYTISLSPFNTLGPTEQVFVDGAGKVLDPEVRFGEARVNRFVKPPLSGDILVVRGRSHPEIESLVTYLSESSIQVRDPQDGAVRAPVIAVADANQLTIESLLQFQVIIWDDVDGSVGSMGEAQIEAIWNAWRFGVRLYLIGSDVSLSSRILNPASRQRWTEMTGLLPSPEGVGPGMILAMEPRDRPGEFFSGSLDETRFMVIPDLPLSRGVVPGLWMEDGEPRATVGGRPVLIRHPAENSPGDDRARRLVQAFPVSYVPAAVTEFSKALFLNGVAWLLSGECDNFRAVPDGYVTIPQPEAGPCAAHILHASIANNGRCSARGVFVTNVAPAGFSVVGARILSNPPGVNSGVILRRGRETIFAVGQVKPDTAAEVQVDVIPLRTGPYTSVFTSSALYRQPEVTLVEGESTALPCQAPSIAIRQGPLGVPEIRVTEIEGNGVQIESSGDMKTWKLEGVIPIGDWVPVGDLVPMDLRPKPLFLRATL